jgi:DNA adenine methylase
MNSDIDPAIRWPGGKSCLLKHLLPLIPPHNCYVEPFAGGLALLLAHPRSAREVINDANDELIGFYRCVRYHRDALLDELEFALNSRREFADYIAQPGLTDIQRAARWFFRNKNGFAGANTSFGTSALSGGAAHGSRLHCLEKIRALNQRLDKVVIECGGWRRMVEIYDASSTFFFLDPPYLGDAGGQSYAAWSIGQVGVAPGTGRVEGVLAADTQ